MAETDLLSDPLLEKAPVHEGYKTLKDVVLYQKLGQGGMGAVYKGRHLRLNVDVAVKVMAPPAGVSPTQADNFIKRFIREAQMSASIRHQNLIRVSDVDTQAGVYFLVMDYVDGESAGERLKRKGRLSEQEAVEICLGAAEGLARAHERGVVHRDVKVDNILIDKRGDVVVADLGLAKAFEAGESDSALSMGLSMSQQAMGTPLYMSPEQTKSAKDVGPQADVWSLGVTLYQLVTNTLPFEDSDLAELIMKIRKEPLPDIKAACPGGLSDDLCAIVTKALSKEPAGRYADCREMAKALRGHLASLGASEEGTLADAQAGTTKLSLVSVTPPAAETMTLIAQAALVDMPGSSDVRPEGRAAVRDSARQAAPAPVAQAESATPVTVPPDTAARGGKGGLLALVLLVLLAGGGGAAWYFLAGPGSRRDEPASVTGTAGASGGLSAEERGAQEEAERKKREAEARVAGILKTARSFRDAGLLEKARDKASEVLEIVPDHGEARKFLADVGAEIAAKQSAAERAAEHRKWTDEGLRLRLAGKLHGAATAYERAQASAPAGNTEAAEAAAECTVEDYKAQAMDAEAKGDYERAVELYAQAVAKRDTPDLRGTLADAKRKLDKKRAGEARRAEAARWRSRAEEAERRGDMKAALGYYQEAAKHGADVSSKVSSLGREIARREEAARRQAAYDDAMSRARPYAGRGQWKEAGAAYEEALRQKPGDSQATRLLAEAKKRLGPAKTMTLNLGGVTMELVLIPAGEFMMGSPASEAKRQKDETQHRVRITKPFYMGKYEVTQAQHQAVMGANPSKFKGASNPVEMVSWNNATEFCRKLSQRTGQQVRLPTEAEWEYACRAGTTTPFHYGNSLSSTQANFNGRYPYGGAAKGDYRGKTMPVGSFQPNAWSLYDMHGNVWEWCADWYENYGGAATDPTGPANGGYRVLRGGGWNNNGYSCRSASRYWNDPSNRNLNYGFRVVVPPSPGR